MGKGSIMVLKTIESDSENSTEETSAVVPSQLLEDAYLSLIDKIHRSIEAKHPFFSLEFFPPRTRNGAANLLSRFENMGKGGPLFMDVTWHPTANLSSGDAENSSLSTANACLNYGGHETLLHVTCSYLNKQEITHLLGKAQRLGLRNIMALRGDYVKGVKQRRASDLQYASDLVSHIRSHFEQYFTVCVAAYPQGHPEASSYNDDLRNLKKKVDAGADFIVTQLFFDVDAYLKFVKDCHLIGITVPIIPGIMPIQSYDSLQHIIKLTKMEIPDDLLNTLLPLKGNDEAVSNFGIHFTTNMCHKLLSAGVPGLHFFTLNREVATTKILKQLGLWRNCCPQRPLPWKLAPNPRRCTELIRPIFWSSRPKSYVHRTMTWDEFPNGRWGRPDSPALGELKDYYLFYLKSKSTKEELLKMWGEKLESEQEVWDVFHCYLSQTPNKQGIKVTEIPWNDGELNKETSFIQKELEKVNKRGILTINSQPAVNGVSSQDTVFGWGQTGGYVYQKGYLEFFTSYKNIPALRDILPKFPHVNYHIINKSGRYNFTNCSKHRPIAVTWGVFPGMEIIQPTVVDPKSFKVWKDEAFDLWNEQWGKLYPKGSFSQQLIQQITDTYFLVNLVDNDYPKGNSLWNVLEAMFDRKAALEETSSSDWDSDESSSMCSSSSSLDL